MSDSLYPRPTDSRMLMQYVHDHSSIELKDIPRALGELERLRAELLSVLCTAAAQPRTIPESRRLSHRRGGRGQAQALAWAHL